MLIDDWFMIDDNEKIPIRASQREWGGNKKDNEKKKNDY